MKLTKQQLFVQEKLILASHPWLSLEEAKEKELWYGCILSTNEQYKREPVGTIKKIWWLNKPQECKDMSQYDIIWLPPTLARVLNALGGWWSLQYEHYPEQKHMIAQTATRTYITRKLLNEDWTSCDLWEQSQETQESIALLLWWENA